MQLKPKGSLASSHDQTEPEEGSDLLYTQLFMISCLHTFCVLLSLSLSEALSQHHNGLLMQQHKSSSRQPSLRLDPLDPCCLSCPWGYWCTVQSSANSWQLLHLPNCKLRTACLQLLCTEVCRCVCTRGLNEHAPLRSIGLCVFHLLIFRLLTQKW